MVCYLQTIKISRLPESQRQVVGWATVVGYSRFKSGYILADFICREIEEKLPGGGGNCQKLREVAIIVAFKHCLGLYEFTSTLAYSFCAALL